MSDAATARPGKRSWRKIYLKQLHTWHWMSAAVSLIGMLLFAATGITLNHADSIPAKPVVVAKAGTLPPGLLRTLTAKQGEKAALPEPVVGVVERVTGLVTRGKPGDWTDLDVTVTLPRPGGDAWVSIDRESGAITSEVTTRGWISYLNDLHKGRNLGDAWFWFIDLFAGACILFTLTGLLLLQLHSRQRRSTWPIVALGLAVPVLLVILFIH